MKTLGVIFLAFACVFALPPPVKHLLGSKQCTWGPSYWCTNLTAAAGCHAVPHCIQTVWIHKDYPADNDSICQTCKKMVTQARDQLESNETQEEIKEVFEGSCKLIPIKIINQECCKLADDFIPELVDTLASQMNPDVVCSVAGLCNNARYDQLIADHSTDVVTKHPPAVKTDTCTGCHTVVDILEKRFNGMSRNDYLESLLQVCGRMGSFSDACSEIIINYFSDIYTHTKENFNSNNICLLSGECSAGFHVHDIEITPLSDVGVVGVSDDLPCDLCKQLVAHLRDILVADTTEEEFKKVLEGLCKQTQGFQKQCLSIVEEYYTIIYKFLIKELNSTEVCSLINICPINSDKIVPIMPLLPSKTAGVPKEQVKPLVRVGVSKSESNVKVIKPVTLFENQSPDLMQLPIERMNRPLGNNLYNKELCTFCEYFLHYAQQAITDPKTEDRIKHAIDKACTILPSSVNETCIEFVSTYSDALVALLAQEIDPSTICPLIQVCPGKDVQDIEIFMQRTPEDKANCPLCLLAVTKLEEMVKNRRTKDNIKTALNTLCSHLSGNVQEECQDFVNTYTDELVEMLVDEFKPQEVCVYLKVCKDDKPAPSLTDIGFVGLTSTNEIPDFTANGKIMKPSHSITNRPKCVLCEFVIEKLHTILKDKKNEDEIKTEIRYVCNHMPQSIKKECNDFVDKYADLVFALIVSEAKPNEICQMMNLCDKKVTEHPVENVGSPQCTLCKLVMTQIETLIGKASKDDIINALDKVCSILPKSEEDSCDDFIKKYGDSIYNLLVLATSPSEICSLLMLCDEHQPEDLQYHINKCAVCESTAMIMKIILENPNADHAIEHVLEKSCRGLSEKHQKMCIKLLDEFGEVIYTLLKNSKDSSKVCKAIDVCGQEVARPVLVGANKCTFGPSFWCASEDNANFCGTGAIHHCKTKVWNGDAPK